MKERAFGNEDTICPVMPSVGRYIMKLRKINGIWKVYQLNWGPLFQYGKWRFDRSTSITPEQYLT